MSGRPFAASGSTESHKAHAARTSVPPKQTAASMIAESEKFPTCWSPVDKLLSGGISRGEVLEISGPPGTQKESFVIGVVKSFIEVDEAVLFVDSQNMISPAALDKYFCKCPSAPPHYRRLISHVNINTLPELMVFMHNLPSYLDDHPKTALLVLNSISFPFQSPNLSLSERAGLLDRVKQTLTRVCSSKRLTIVTTSQFATKLINPDGSMGNFDTGSKAILVPQLGPSYLPSSRTHRLIIVPETPTSGVVRVLSSPTYQPGRGSAPQECYVLTKDGYPLS